MDVYRYPCLKQRGFSFFVARYKTSRTVQNVQHQNLALELSLSSKDDLSEKTLHPEGFLSVQVGPKEQVFVAQDTWDNEVSDTRALPRSKPQLFRRNWDLFHNGLRWGEAENGKVCTTEVFTGKVTMMK